MFSSPYACLAYALGIRIDDDRVGLSAFLPQIMESSAPFEAARRVRALFGRGDWCWAMFLSAVSDTGSPLEAIGGDGVARGAEEHLPVFSGR